MKSSSLIKVIIKQNVMLSISQVVVFLVMFYIFLNYAPWVFSHDLNDLEKYEYSKEPPEWAVAFTVGHGKYFFFSDSPQTNPLKKWSIISAIFIGWLYLVITVLVSSKKHEGFSWFKFFTNTK